MRLSGPIRFAAARAIFREDWLVLRGYTLDQLLSTLRSAVLRYQVQDAYPAIWPHGGCCTYIPHQNFEYHHIILGMRVWVILFIILGVKLLTCIFIPFNVYWPSCSLIVLQHTDLMTMSQFNMAGFKRVCTYWPIFNAKASFQRNFIWEVFQDKSCAAQ